MSLVLFLTMLYGFKSESLPFSTLQSMKGYLDKITPGPSVPIASAEPDGSNIPVVFEEPGLPDQLKGVEPETETANNHNLQKFIGDRPLRVWIMETWKTHDEVYSALIHAFGNLKNTELRTFLGHKRFNIDKILDEINANLLSPVVSDMGTDKIDQFLDTHEPPDIMVSTSCDGDIKYLKNSLTRLLNDANTHLFCVFHMADWFEAGHRSYNPLLHDWAEAGRVDFVALSEHVVKYMRETTIPGWNLTTPQTYRSFPPVFPVSTHQDESLNEIFLAMQGNYSPERRNYKRIFNQLESITEVVKNLSKDEKPKDVGLHLIGHGDYKAEVPDNIKSQVHFDEDLEYPAYYDLLSNSFAVLPAFASHEYLYSKASSTVAAAMIAGVPLVASEELLERYTYVPRDSVWLTKEGEDELDTVLSVVMSDESEYLRKRDLVKAHAKHLMAENIQMVGIWVEEALAKRGPGPVPVEKEEKEESKGDEKKAEGKSE